MRPFDGPHSLSTSGTQADNCNDLLHLQPMMAGPYLTAQSPESLPIPSSQSALLGLPFGAISHPTRLPYSVLHPYSWNKARGPYQLLPRHQTDSGFPHHSVRLAMRRDTAKAFSYQGRWHERQSIPILANPFSYLRFWIRRGTGSPQAALDLAVLHPPFQTAPINRHSPPPNLLGSQHLICSYKSQSLYFSDITLADVT